MASLFEFLYALFVVNMHKEMYMYKNLFAFNNSTASDRGKDHNPSATARCNQRIEFTQ